MRVTTPYPLTEITAVAANAMPTLINVRGKNEAMMRTIPRLRTMEWRPRESGNRTGGITGADGWRGTCIYNLGPERVNEVLKYLKFVLIT